MKNIQEFIDRDYVTDVRKNRRKVTQEFFTPYSIIKRMCDKIPDDEWADPEKTFLEPCMGDGNIVCYIVWNRIQHGIDWQTTLKTLAGVELMYDNVKETKERVIDLLDKMNITYDKETAMEIMDKNLVCADFFNWDFENWNYVIMNPPFSITLHLKFLENCIKYCDTVVNISPGGFIFDIGRYNNLKSKTKNILPHLYEYERLDNRTSSDLFSAGIMGDLHIGIYKHDYTDGKADIDEEQNKIYEKIRYTFKHNLRNKFIRKDKLSKYGLRIYLYHYDATQEAYKNIICFEGKAVNGIDFKSKQEQQNFIDSLKTWPYIFMNKLEDVNPAHLPWLEDYNRKYTDDDMYKIFKITDEEKDFIKKFLENVYF